MFATHQATRVGAWLRWSGVMLTVVFAHSVFAESPTTNPAVDGYCLPSYFTTGKAIKGTAKFQSRYVGEVYYFIGEEAKKAFDRDPAKFLPQFGGWCTMAMGGPYGNRIASDPSVFMIQDDKLYLFSSERAKKAYEAHPQGVLARARQIFADPALYGNCPVSYFTERKAVKGKPEFTVVYQRRVYHLASDAARKKFIANPEAFLPQYNGYCATSIADRTKYFSDSESFVIVDGKLYLFLNDDAKKKFELDARGTIQRADEAWSRIKDVY